MNLAPVRLVLYSTSACHLCEQAEEVVYAALVETHFSLSKIDIALDDALIDRYGIYIPVLARLEENKIPCELFWPFNQQDVLQFIAKT